MSSSSLVVAVAGATGAVGREMLKTLEQRDFPATRIKALASSRSAGTTVPYKDGELTVEELTEDSFAGVRLALFSAGGSTSEKFAPVAVKAGCVVVDNSSAWRMDEKTPLVVPEVNPHDLEWHNGIIANPNCSTIQMVVALKPLHDVAKIKRVVVSTYQAVSGTGAAAMQELQDQVHQWAEGKEITKSVYPHQIAFNLIPQVDSFDASGYTKEELKMVNEGRKILNHPKLKVSTTCVRVPVLRAHSIAISAEFEKPVSVERARAVIAAFPGAEVIDNPANKEYPMPWFQSGKDKCAAGRIRKDDAFDNGLSLWVVGDQLWKGAALNAIQIAEELHKMGTLKRKAK